MEQDKIIDEIIEVGFILEIIVRSADEIIIKRSIEKLLAEESFIENLYNAIFLRAKEFNVLSHERIISLLIELEKIRLHLETNSSGLNIKSKELTIQKPQDKIAVKRLK